MYIRKLLNKSKNHLLLIAITLTFLSLFAFLVKNKIDSSNIDYSIRDYSSRTLNNRNYGLWYNMTNFPNSLFSKSQGEADFLLEGNLKELEDSKFQKGFNSLTIALHERVEISSSNATIHLKNGVYNLKESTISFPDQTTRVRSIKADNYFEVKKCEINALITLQFNLSLKRYQEILNLNSSNCSEFDLTIKGNLLSKSLKLEQVVLHFLFSLVIIGLLIACIILLEMQLELDVTANHQISMTSLLIMGTLQLVLGFEQIVFALFNFPCFILIVLIGILYFNLFFFLLFKTIASAVRYQMMHHVQNNQNFNLRQYILFVYCKAHIVILLTFFVSLKLIDSPKLYYLWAFALLPQLIKNFISRTRFLSSQYYILSTSF